MNRQTATQRACFAVLAANPRMGRRAEAIRSDVRRHAHGAHVIFYREDAEVGDVLIVTVLHSRMRPDLKLDDRV